MKSRYTSILTLLLIIFTCSIIQIHADLYESLEPGSATQYHRISYKTQQNEYDEDFQIFRKKFFSDSIFQISRIQFPVQIFNLDREKFWLIVFGEPVDTLKLMPKNNWYFHYSLESDTAYYEVKIKFDDKLVVYVERGKDFGIATVYKFIILDGKWFLTRVEYINL